MTSAIYNPSIRLPPNNKFVNDTRSIRSLTPVTTQMNSFTMAPVLSGQSTYSYSPAGRSKISPGSQQAAQPGLQSVQTNPLYLENNQQIHQRIIMHQPQAFPQRNIYYTAQNTTPVFQSFNQQKPIIKSPIQQNIVQQTPKAQLKTAVFTYQNRSNPLVQTIQGNQYADSQIAKNSFAPPAPAPRQFKSCCSPWILGLIGLLALLALLITILVGKQTSNGSQVSVSQTVPVGKVGTISPMLVPNTSQNQNSDKQSGAIINQSNKTIQGITSVTPIPLPSASSAVVNNIPSNLSIINQTKPMISTKTAKAKPIAANSIKDDSSTNIQTGISFAPTMTNPNSTSYPTTVKDSMPNQLVPKFAISNKVPPQQV